MYFINDYDILLYKSLQQIQCVVMNFSSTAPELIHKISFGEKDGKTQQKKDTLAPFYNIL